MTDGFWVLSLEFWTNEKFYYLLFVFYLKNRNFAICNKSKEMKNSSATLCYKIGYYISLFGVATILLWIGAFKFTHTEAEGIKPLVEHSFLLSWLYKILSLQGVSNLIGVIEIAIALALIIGICSPIVRKLAFVGCTITFLITLSFLFTSAKTYYYIEGVPVTDFFILKDIPMLGFGMISVNKPK